VTVFHLDNAGSVAFETHMNLLR